MHTLTTSLKVSPFLKSIMFSKTSSGPPIMCNVYRSFIQDEVDDSGILKYNNNSLTILIRK